MCWSRVFRGPSLKEGVFEGGRQTRHSTPAAHFDRRLFCGAPQYKIEKAPGDQPLFIIRADPSTGWKYGMQKRHTYSLSRHCDKLGECEGGVEKIIPGHVFFQPGKFGCCSSDFESSSGCLSEDECSSSPLCKDIVDPTTRFGSTPLGIALDKTPCGKSKIDKNGPWGWKYDHYGQKQAKVQPMSLQGPVAHCGGPWRTAPPSSALPRCLSCRH